MEISEVIKQAAQAIKDADVLLITAGAGMGVDSGLPDFRGDQGFWKAYPALQGYSFIDMANPEWFESDPQRAWGFYGHRLNLYRKTVPHQGFQLLLQWTLEKTKSSFVYTSNVDGQFQKAGFDPDCICECHGSIHHWQELNGRGEIHLADGIELDIDEKAVRLRGDLPRHPLLRGDVRPNILMFGDFYWQSERTDQQYDRFDAWIEQHQNAKVTIIEMGAGTAIPSVRNQGERLLHQNPSARLIRINPRESQCRHHDQAQCFSIPLGALEALSQIQASYESL
jgi:NAD-dependent SIR2 family protein deacetylase